MLKLKLMFPLLFIAALGSVLAGVKDSSRAFSAPLDPIKARSLCGRGERLVWSCQTARERKLASICSSQDLSRTRGYVQYRFGRPGQVELEFPRQRVSTQTLFRYSRYTRPLVTMLKLEFTNDGVTYTISDDSNDEEKPGRRDAVITITPAGANAKESTISCRQPVTGSLMTLEDVVQRMD
jgi:hypothetical protein